MKRHFGRVIGAAIIVTAGTTGALLWARGDPDICSSGSPEDRPASCTTPGEGDDPSPPDSATPPGASGAGGSCPAGSDPHLPVNASDVPRRVGEDIIYRDGTRVRANDPSGRPGRINPDGSVTYPDGTRVAHNSTTGDTSITHPDGSVSRTNVSTPGEAGSDFVWSDGMRISQTDSSGGQGEVQPDGSIHYPDGTQVSHDPRTGDTKVTNPDGTTETNRWSGARHDDAGDWRWNDGEGAPGSDPSGGEGTEGNDGWIRYPDGTLISHDAGTGLTKYIRPDGSTTVANGCERETVTITGSCLGEPAVIDKCMVGSWEMTNNPALEFLRGKMPDTVFSQMNNSPVRMTIDKNGTFRTETTTLDYQTTTTTHDGPRVGGVDGTVGPQSGQWSAKNGRLRACTTTTSKTRGKLEASSPKATKTVPFLFTNSGNGSVAYACGDTEMSTQSGPMTFRFRRTSALPPRSTR